MYLGNVGERVPGCTGGKGRVSPWTPTTIEGKLRENERVGVDISESPQFTYNEYVKKFFFVCSNWYC